MSRRSGAGPDGPGGERLVRAAVAVLLRDGLARATTRAVTEEAGVGRGLLNHYFRWPVLRAKAWGLVFEEALADQFPGGVAPNQALERYLSTAFEPDAVRYWVLWVEAVDLAQSDPDLRAAWGAAQAALQAALAVCIAEGVAQGLWRCAQPAAAALRLLALNDGLAGLVLAEVAGFTLEQAEAHLRYAAGLECPVGARGGGGR